MNDDHVAALRELRRFHFNHERDLAAIDAAILALTSPATQGAAVEPWGWLVDGVPFKGQTCCDKTAIALYTAPAASPRDGVTDAELARLREIEHRCWHMLDNAEDLGDSIGIERNDPDHMALDALLPEDHPEASPSPATEQAGACVVCDGTGRPGGEFDPTECEYCAEPAAPVGADAVERVSGGGLTGELVEIGDDEEGNPRVVISATRDAIRNCKLIPFRFVHITQAKP